MLRALAFILLLASPTIRSMAQAPVLEYLTAESDGADVLLKWGIPNETGITQFKVYRKMPGTSSFEFLADLNPSGVTHYVFRDDKFYKEAPLNIEYRLTVVRGTSTYHFYTTMLHNPTSVQRTWGSIKSMFR